MNTKRSTFKEIIYLFTTILSWTIFALLIICAILLVYYFIATKIYAKKGSGYEPRFSLYTIISPSMTPNIKVYDVVVDVKVNSPEDVNIGDVITFNSDRPELHGGTITHRVISITKDNDGNYLYQTKGDANLMEDEGLVPYEKIVGKVSFKIPQLGRIQFFLASSFGWIVVILVPTLYVIIKDILKALKIIRDPNDQSNKFLAKLNRPLIFTPRPKLLTYAANTTAKKEKTIKEKPKEDLNKLMEYADEDEDKPLPVKNEEPVPDLDKLMSYAEEDEEDVDLPSLK